MAQTGRTNATNPGTYRVRPNADEIPCPFLVSAYNHGDLVPEADGTLHRDVIEETLARVGLGKEIRSALAALVVSKAGDRPSTMLNLFELRDSGLDHTGSTGVRDPEVDPSRLPELLAFAEHGRMYHEHFAAAARHFGQIEPGEKGALVEAIELTALVEVFGREDEAGQRYLTENDIQRLWLEGQYPEGWVPRPRDAITVEVFLAAATKTCGTLAVERLKGLLG
jgi:hypothetical protein